MSYTLMLRLNPRKGFSSKLFSVGQFDTSMCAYLYYTQIKTTSKQLTFIKSDRRDIPIFFHTKTGKEYTLEYYVVKSKQDYSTFDEAVAILS